MPRGLAEATIQLDLQIIEVVEMDAPMSVRHVFYRMTDPRLEAPVSKDQKGYLKVMNRLLALRRSGRVHYRDIVDTSRRGYYVPTYPDGAAFLSDLATDYRGDLWKGVGHRVEVWCESRSIAGVLEDTCRDYAVALYPAGGFSSETFVYQAAQSIIRNGQNTTLLYVGDYDPAGVLIDTDIEEKMNRHLDGTVDLEFSRIAVNKQQIAAMGLPTKPRKDTDRRSLQVESTVEAEAVPAPAMRAMLAEELRQFIPDSTLATQRFNDFEERTSLKHIAQAISHYGVTTGYAATLLSSSLEEGASFDEDDE